MTVGPVRPWRPSPSHFRAAVVGVVGLAAALLFRLPSLLVLTAPFAIVAGWSAAMRPVGPPVVSGRLAPSTVREGEGTAWTATWSDADRADHVIASSPDRLWIETRPTSGVAIAAVADGEASVSVPMRSTRWGHHDVGPIAFVTVSSWGAFRSKGLDGGLRISTLPLPDRFDATPTRLRADGLVGLHRSTNPGDGSEFASLRPFRAGDRLRRINWRRSLRSGELHVTTTYADQDIHVALIVDALDDFGVSGGIDGAASSLDTTVRAAGAVAEHFLLGGDRVSLRILGPRRSPNVPPATGSGHLRRILDVLTSVEPDPSRLPPIRNRLDAVPHGALVVMLSPLVSPTALERASSIASHGIGVAVIDTLPDDVHLDDDPVTSLAWRIRLLERRREVRTIQEIGVPVTRWQGPGSLDPFLRDLVRRAALPRMARR
ncbi:MAG: DUF58 domain-containing protein [Actinomycetota bacterium]